MEKIYYTFNLEKIKIIIKQNLKLLKGMKQIKAVPCPARTQILECCYSGYSHSCLLPPGLELGLDGPAFALPFPACCCRESLLAVLDVQCSAFLHTAVPFTLSLSPWCPWPVLLLQPACFGVSDGAPQLEDEVVRESKCLQVRLIHRLGELHCVLLLLTQLPDLGSCEGKQRVLPHCLWER